MALVEQIKITVFVGTRQLPLLPVDVIEQVSNTGHGRWWSGKHGFKRFFQFGDRYYVFGWACQRGSRASIDVHIYAGGAAGGKPPGTFLTGGKADLDNEPAVDRECQDANGGKHRFKIELSNQLLRTFQRKSLFAHGIAVVGNVENAAISQSGKFQLPSPKWPPDPPTPNFSMVRRSPPSIPGGTPVS